MKRANLLSLICLLISIFSTSAFAQIELPKKPEKPPETAEEWVNYARWLHMSEPNYNKEIEALNKAIELEPSNINAYYFRGVFKQAKGNYKDAIEDFNTVIQYDPDVTNTYILRAQARMQLNKDLDGALADYDLLITRLAAKNLIMYNAFQGRGILRFLKSDYDGAIVDFTAAEKMKRSDNCRFYRGLVFWKKGNIDAALEDFKYLTDIYQQINASSKEKFPQYYTEKEKYPYDQNPLASLKPKNVGVTKGATTIVGVPTATVISADSDNLPKILPPQILPPKKEISFKEKLLIDTWFDIFNTVRLGFNFGDDTISYYFYGQLLEIKGDKQLAEEAYTNAIIIEDENFAAHFNRGKIRLSDGKFEPAVRDFSWTISTEPNYAEAYLERGIAIFLMGHDLLAQKDFDIYLKFAPDKKTELNKRIVEAKKQREAEKKKQASK